ncbi:unnamed protein product [Merluccius merluccius]
MSAVRGDDSILATPPPPPPPGRPFSRLVPRSYLKYCARLLNARVSAVNRFVRLDTSAAVRLFVCNVTPPPTNIRRDASLTSAPP